MSFVTEDGQSDDIDCPSTPFQEDETSAKSELAAATPVNANSIGTPSQNSVFDPGVTSNSLLPTPVSPFAVSLSAHTPSQVDHRVAHDSPLGHESVSTPHHDARSASQLPVSFVLNDTPSPHPSIYPTGLPFQDLGEAHYFKHYIDSMSAWIDICDPHAHFATEVPRRAFHSPLLMNAILAVSAKQLNLTGVEANTHSEHYHSECLGLLIPKLNHPTEALNENTLAAIVILRSYEEMSGMKHAYP